MNKKTMAIARAAGVVGATAALVVGVTLANLSSTASLTANNIASATADLTVWNGSSFSSTATGFTVTGLVPGVGSGNLPFYFRNGGGVNLNVTVHVPVTPTSSGFSGWNNLKVVFTNDFTATTVTTDMQALLAGDVALPGNPLAAGAQGNSGVPGTQGNYKVSFDIVPASITGSHVTVGNFDLVFTGTQP